MINMWICLKSDVFWLLLLFNQQSRSERQKIGSVFVFVFCSKNDWNDYSIIKIVGELFFICAVLRVLYLEFVFDQCLAWLVLLTPSEKSLGGVFVFLELYFKNFFEFLSVLFLIYQSKTCIQYCECNTNNDVWCMIWCSSVGVHCHCWV